LEATVFNGIAAEEFERAVSQLLTQRPNMTVRVDVHGLDDGIKVEYRAEVYENEIRISTTHLNPWLP